MVPAGSARGTGSSGSATTQVASTSATPAAGIPAISAGRGCMARWASAVGSSAWLPEVSNLAVPQHRSLRAVIEVVVYRFAAERVRKALIVGSRPLGPDGTVPSEGILTKPIK